MRWMHWISFFISLWIDSALNLCNCGEGGICREDASSQATDLISAVPCSCRQVSNGIFVTKENNCDQIVDYCSNDPCGSNWKQCMNGLGTFYCVCDPGWEGHKCDSQLVEGQIAKIFLIWYSIPIRDNEVIVITNSITHYVQLKIEFNDERTTFYRVQEDCKQVSYHNLKNKYKSIKTRTSLGRIVTHYTLIIGYTSHTPCFSCKIPLLVTSGENVYVDGVNGPFGQYHDVKFTIFEKSTVHYDGVFRVFVKSIGLVRDCDFQLIFSGCGKTRKTADQYSLSSRIKLLVSTVSPYDSPRCQMKSCTYSWSVSDLQRTGPPTPLSQGNQIIIFRPATDFPRHGTAVVLVNITFKDVIGSYMDESIIGACYLNIIPDHLDVHIYRGNREIKCGVLVSVQLKSVVESNIPSIKLTYEWACPAELCKNAPRNDEILEFVAAVACENDYEIGLRVNRLGTKLEARDNCTLRFVKNPYNFFATCEPDCEHATSVTPLTVTAEEEPKNPDSVFSWKMEDGDHWFDTTCISASPSNVALIKTNTLLPGDVVRFEISTHQGFLLFSIKGSKAPSKFECNIMPKEGIAYVDKFSISCYAASDSPPLTYWIQEGSKRDLNIISTSNEINELELTDTPILVNVTDNYGASSYTYVNVVLHQPSDYEAERILRDVPSRIDQLQSLLHEKAYIQTVSIVDRISKLARFSFPFHWKHRLVEILLRVEHCNEAECIIKRANAIKRLMSVEVENNTQGVDDFILKAAGTLYGLIESMDKLTFEKNKFNAYDMLPILTSIYDAVLQCIKFVDPVLYSPYVDEDVRQLHFRKVQEGNSYARLAFTKLGFFVANHISVYSSIFELKIRESEGASTTVISHTLEYINCALGLNQTRSYTQLNIAKLPHLRVPGIHPAATITHYGSKSFWWYRREGTEPADQMFDVHLYKRIGSQRSGIPQRISGPVRTYIRHTYEKHFETISGVIEPNGKNPNSVIHRIFAPRGHGALILLFPSNLMNRMNISIDHDRSMIIPENINATMSTRMIFHKYYFGENQHLYVGVSPLDNLTNYSFDYLIIRCVTWSEDMWKSELCEIVELKEMVVCECRHLSLVNVETLAPSHSLVPRTDIDLVADISPKYYALLVISILSCCFLGLVLLVFRLEKSGRSSKKATFLHDNYPGDNYPYLVAVFTGGRFFSGTSAHVALRLIGEKRFSKVHILTSKLKPHLSQGEDSWFILFTTMSLGNVRGIELWHDNCGAFHGWYCKKVVVWDLQTYLMFEFSVQSWLNASTLIQRGETTYLVESAGLNKQSAKYTLTLECMEALFRQGHNWASVFVPHPRNRNSRLERVAILAALILVTIATSMLFYTSTGVILDEPSVRYTTSDFQVSLISVAISTAVTIFLSVIFREGKDRMRSDNWRIESSKTSMNSIQAYFHWLVTYLPVTTSDEKLKYKKIWLLLFGYVTCGIIIVSCVVVIIYVGYSFSRNRSVIWFFSFTIALFIEAFILNPLMIIVIALVVAHCIRISPTHFVKITVDPQTDEYPFQKFNLRLNAALNQRTLPMYKPPLWVDLVEKADTSYRRGGVNRVDAISITLLLSLVFIIVCTFNDILTYHRNWVLSEIFRGGKPEESYLDTVQNRTRYFDHLRGTVLPSLHRLNWYNGRPLPIEKNEPDLASIVIRPTREYRGFCADYSSKLLGVPLLRQQRIAPDCQKRISTVFRGKFIQAHGYLTTRNQDTKVYLPKWRTPEKDEVYYKTSSYQTEEETEIGMYFGPTRLQYSGNGYVEHLHWSLGSSLSSLIDLQLDGWLDNVTRCVFFTFNLYDIHIGTVASVSVITESLPSGVYASRFVVDSMPVSISRFPYKKVELASVMFIAAILAFHVTRSALLLTREGPRQFLFRLPGLVNLVMVLSGIGFFVLFAVSFFIVLDTLDRLGSLSRNEFTPLFHMFESNNTTIVFFGVFSAMVSVSAALLIHTLFGFEGFERALVSTWLLVMVSFIILITLTLYSVVTLYLFDVVVMSHLSFINILRHMIALESEYFSSPQVHELSLIVFFVTLVLVRLNSGIIVLIYFEAAERIRTKRDNTTEALRFSIHRYAYKRRDRRWAFIRRFYSPPKHTRPSPDKMIDPLKEMPDSQQRSHSMFSESTPRSNRSVSTESRSQ